MVQVLETLDLMDTLLVQIQQEVTLMDFLADTDTSLFLEFLQVELLTLQQLTAKQAQLALLIKQILQKRHTFTLLLVDMLILLLLVMVVPTLTP
jgi:hypothetical protein